MTWEWSVSLHRYRDSETGRILSKQAALSFVDASLSAGGDATSLLASMVGSDPPLIAPSDWRDVMREEIKGEYIRQYLLGRGGRSQMTPADWGSVGGMLTEQYGYLDNFLAEIEAGNLSEAQIRARAAQYVNSAREAYERADERVQLAAGYDEVRWVTNPAAEHCDDCVAYEAMGWVKVADNPFGGCVPGQACTACGVNCGCHREYRKSGG